MARILLKNGKIFDGERFFFGSVLTEDERIAAIGENIEAEGALTVNCEGCTVCPGLVDIHTHLLELSGLPYGFPAALATVPFGVTAAVDAGASAKNAENAESLPIDTAALISLPQRDKKIDFSALDRGFGLYKERAVGVKIYFDRGQPDLVCTAEQVREASEYARSKGMLTMVHCTDSPTDMETLVSALSKGDIITHAYHGAPQSIEEDHFRAYCLAKERGVIIDAGMAGGVHTDFALLRRAIEGGYYPDTVSTDITRFSAYIRGGIYGLTMCMSIFRALGMPEEQVLSAVTSRAAKAVRREGVFGSLALGRKADIAVLSFGKAPVSIEDRWGNAFASDEGYTCRLTVKNGQILYRNGI